MRWAEARMLLTLKAPLHPIFVHFTVGLSIASFLFDLLGWAFGAARSAIARRRAV